MINRRQFGKGGLAAVTAAGLSSASVVSSYAQGAEVKVALIAPMSGAWARQGELMKKGGELAIKHINDAGGIKSMGGAKMQLVVVDAGDSCLLYTSDAADE